jgi:plastocyanin
MTYSRFIPFALALVVAAVGIGYHATHTHAATVSHLQVVDTSTGRPVDRLVAIIKQVSTTQAAVVVGQKNKTFTPAAVELRTGQVLEIANDDAVTHNAFCQSGDFKFNAGTQPPGSNSQVTFTKAGVYEVRCAIHPKMILKVTVTD